MLSSFFFVVLITFILNISVLFVNLALYWTAKSKYDFMNSDSCTKICLPQLGRIVCDCQSKVLRNYLEKEFTEATINSQHLNQDDSVTYHVDQSMDFQLKPTAKLNGAKDTSSRHVVPRNGMTSLLSWHNGNDCHMSNGMLYRDGRLTVPLDGMYFIYGQLEVSFDKHNNSTRGQYHVEMTKSNIFEGEHTLFRYSVPDVVFLSPATSSIDVCVASTVRLRAQDELYIRVSDTENLYNPANNFIGAYML